MDKVQLLERYYNAFMGAEVKVLHEFLDYMDYLRSIPEFVAILQPLEEERKRKLQEFKKRKLPPGSIYRLDFDVEKDMELWGCWNDLCSMTKDTVINIEYLSPEEDFPSPERLRSSVTRIHNYLLKEIGEPSHESRFFSFDEGKSVLKVGNKEVPIQKFSRQYELLRVIARDKYKDWQFSEISELMGIEALFKWKDLYDVAYTIKKKVALEAGIRDVFITTTQSIKINEKYLGKS